MAVDQIVPAEANRIRPQSDGATRQELDLRRLQDPLHSPDVLGGWQASARFEIFYRTQPDIRLGGEPGLRPIQQPTRGAAGQSSQEHFLQAGKLLFITLRSNAGSE